MNTDKSALVLLKIILTQLEYSYEQISNAAKLAPSKFGMVIGGKRFYKTRDWLKIVTKIDERIEDIKTQLENMDQLTSVQQNVKKFREKIFNITLPDGPMYESAANYIEKPYVNTLLGYVTPSPVDYLTKVVGPPMSGKTTLLHKFKERLKEENLGEVCYIDFSSWGFAPGANVPMEKIVEKILSDILKVLPKAELPEIPKAKYIRSLSLTKDWLKDCFKAFHDSLKQRENLFLILDNLDASYLYQEKSEIAKTEEVLKHLLKETLRDIFEENTNKNIFAVISFAALMKPESSAVESSDLDLHTTQYVNIEYFTKDDIDYMLELIGCTKKLRFKDNQESVIRELLLRLYHGSPYLTSNALYAIFKSEEDFNEEILREKMIPFEDKLWQKSLVSLDAQIKAMNTAENISAQKLIDDFIDQNDSYLRYSVLLQKLYIEHLGKESSLLPEYIKAANRRNKSTL